MRTLREISEAMTPDLIERMDDADRPSISPIRYEDALGISIFCDEAVRKALVEWVESESDYKTMLESRLDGVNRGYFRSEGARLMNRAFKCREAALTALTASVARAQEK